MTFNILSAGDPGNASPVMQNFKHVNYGNTLNPVNSSGVTVDNTIDLGSVSGRFKDAYVLNFEGAAGSEICFNNDGLDIDFRFEASGAANAFFIQGSSGNVGIGTSLPGTIGGGIGAIATTLHLSASAARLNIEGSASAALSLIDTGASANQKWLFFNNDDGISQFRAINDVSTPIYTFLSMDHSNGNVGIGTSLPDAPLSFANAVGTKINLLGGGAAQPMGLAINTNEYSFYLGSSSRHFTFYSGNNDDGSEIVTILGSGNTGFGVTDPDSIIETFGTGTNFKGSYDATNYFTLDCDSGGDLTITPSGGDINLAGNVGINEASPAAKLDVEATTEQLRLKYNDSNYASFTVSSNGSLTIGHSGGDLNLAGYGGDVYIDSAANASVLRLKTTQNGTGVTNAIYCYSNDSGDNETVMSGMVTDVIDSTNGAEDSAFYIRTRDSGTAVNNVRFQNSALYILDAISSPGTVTGYAAIYVDSADGDLKVKFADGHVATIATDS